VQKAPISKIIRKAAQAKKVIIAKKRKVEIMDLTDNSHEEMQKSAGDSDIEM
jgi:hypothetical protein